MGKKLSFWPVAEQTGWQEKQGSQECEQCLEGYTNEAER
jgi:hypothetical protein